jgi:ribose transport system substrate-binding protein
MSTSRFMSVRTSALVAVAAASCVVLAACGGSSGSSEPSAAASEAASSAASEAPASEAASAEAGVPGLAENQALVDQWMSAMGTYTEPPVEGGPAATPDKSIWIISCGESSSSCARATKGAVEASEAIGWESKVFDTEGDYSQAGEGVRQAIAAKADGIYAYFIDCSYMAEPLKEAREAGIPVVQAEGVDCSVADPAAEDLFAWSVTYNEGSIVEWLQAWGSAQAAYLITAGEGTGNALFVTDNEAVGTLALNEAFETQMQTCTGCTYSVAGYTFAEQYEGLGQKVSSELLKNPDLTQIGVAYDGILQAGVAEAIQQSGNQYTVMAGEGQEPTIELVKSGLVAAGVGLDNEQESWSAIDSLNRIFNDVEPVSSGIGIQIYTADVNIPESGAYVSPVDYKSAYKSAWGVS